MLHESDAACPAAAALIERYRIAFSGFRDPLPLAALDRDFPPQGTRVVSLILIDDGPTVADGFFHTAYIDTTRHQLWILRTGGWINRREWYGPVSTPVLDFSGCPIERRDFPSRKYR